MSFNYALGEIDLAIDDSERLVATIVGFHLSGQREIDRLAA